MTTLPAVSRPVAPLWRQSRFRLGLIVLLALALRVGYVSLRHDQPTIYGGDYQWYADYGRTLVRTGWTLGPPPTGPIYLLLAGYAEQFAPAAFPDQDGWLLRRMAGGPQVFPNPFGRGLVTIRLLNCLLGTLTVLMVFRIGRAAWDERAGLIAAALVAIMPAFVVEAGNPMTESIAIFLLAWVTALWMTRFHAPDWRLMAATGSLLALAALTRSVFLAFILIPLVHLPLLLGWRRALRHGLVLLLAFGLTIAPWTLYNLIQWQRLTLTGEGLLGTLYVGAVGWQDPTEVDAGLGFSGATAGVEDQTARQEAFAQGFVQVVLADPVGYLVRRVGELAESLLQPHNTNVFPGESLKELALTWLREDRSLGGLLRLTQGDAFWPKLAIYVFHYAVMLLGLAGLVISRRCWRALWLLYAPFPYFLGIHLVLAAIPRYLFLLEPYWVLFTAPALATLIQTWQSRRTTRRDGPHGGQASVTSGA